MNAALDGLVREGLDRRALTHGLRGFENGAAARDSRVDVASARRLWRRAAALNPDPLLGLKLGAGLGLSVRSLQRRLKEAGVSFSSLRDETRLVGLRPPRAAARLGIRIGPP